MNLAKIVARETRCAQKQLEQLNGHGAYKALFQLSDHFVAKALSCQCDDDVVPVAVPASIARRIPVVAESMEAQRMNCLQVPFHVHHAARSNEASRGSKSSKQYMAEKSLHKKAASLRHNFPCGIPSACTIYLDSLVAFPGSVPTPPCNPVQVEHEKLIAVAIPWETQSTRCGKNSKANLVRDPRAGKSIGTIATANATTKATTTDAWSLWKPGRLVVKPSSANSSVVEDDAFGIETVAAMHDESKNVHEEADVFSVDDANDELEKVLGCLASALSESLLVPSASLEQVDGETVGNLESPSAVHSAIDNLNLEGTFSVEINAFLLATLQPRDGYPAPLFE